ncbi:hypothetical protein ACFVH0_00995 [Streptomyces sp. NPDC127117]
MIGAREYPYYDDPRDPNEAVLSVRRAEAKLFAMFTDADVIEAVRRRY